MHALCTCIVIVLICALKQVISSHSRQLNNYGFSKMRQDPKNLEFRHPVVWKVSECMWVVTWLGWVSVAMVMNSNESFII